MAQPSGGPYGPVKQNYVLPKTVGNVFYAAGHHAVYECRTASGFCGKLKESQVKQMDYNVIVNDPENNNHVLANWSPSANSSQVQGCDRQLQSADDFQSVFDGSSLHSLYFSEPDLQVFKSRELGNYELIPNFKGASGATVLPVTVQKLLGLSPKYVSYIGAYPSR